MTENPEIVVNPGDGGSVTESGVVAGDVNVGLPPGLTLSPDGVLSGTPTEPGTYQVTVTVTDDAGLTASQVLTITVISPLSITVSIVPDPVSGQAYTFTLTATGGTPPYTWTAS